MGGLCGQCGACVSSGTVIRGGCTKLTHILENTREGARCEQRARAQTQKRRLKLCACTHEKTPRAGLYARKVRPATSWPGPRPPPPLWTSRETSAVSLRAAVLGGDPGFLKENNTLPNKSKGCDKKTGHVHVTTRVHRILTHTHTPMVALPGHIPHPCKHTHISPWPLCAEVDGAVDVIGEKRRNGLCVGFDRRFDLCPLVGLGGRLLCGAR